MPYRHASEKNSYVPLAAMPSVVVELWAMSGIGWRLPISVEWHGDMSITRVRMGGGIALLKKQRAILRKALDEVGVHNESLNSWWIIPDHLKLIAHKVEAEYPDPEDVVFWSQEAGQQEVKPIFESASCNAFLEFYCRDGLLSEPVEAAAAYQDFCNHGLKWMLLHQKPWDLGFAVLYPTPMRADWKQIIEQIIRKKKKAKGGTEPHKTINDRLDLFLMPELLMLLKGGKLIRWGIEVKLRKSWHVVNMRMERAKRLSHRTCLHYISLVHDTLKRLLPYHRDLYITYLRQATCPTYYFRPGKQGQRRDFVHGRSEEWKKHFDGVPPTIRWVGDAYFYQLGKYHRAVTAHEAQRQGFKDYRRQRKAGKPMVEKNEVRLPRVPRIRPPKKVVWDAWSYLENPEVLKWL